MGYMSEAVLEDNLLKKLQTQKYTYVEIKDYEELEKNFKIQIELFNKDKLKTPLTNNEFNRILNYLNGKTIFNSAKQLRDQFILDRDDGTQEYIRFISENPDENIYQVSHQITVVNKYKNRYDVTILINGLPIVQVELKRSGIDVNEAINQINRYKAHSYKGLFHYIQLFVVSNSVETKYFSNTDEPRFLHSLTFYWTDKDNNRICNLDDFSTIFFDQNKLIKMLMRYMVLSESEKSLMVMRPYQIYATEAVINRVLETNLNGYVWHTTGSGKTLTSFKCSQLLIKDPKIKKVIFLVDRQDLDNKTIEDFNAYQKDSVDMTDKTNTLVERLNGKDKLIVSTIQKMSIAVKSEKYKKQIEHLQNEKVVFIFDECHRSQAGEMHVAINRFFNNAQLIGFTGTPIFKENLQSGVKTTTDLFNKCLHQYLISNAIADKNVLGFSVEYIKTYEGQYDENDSTMVEDIDRKEVLEADERITLVANHIIKNHSSKTHDKSYTAIFATSSIDMLVRYYDKFKSIEHNLKIGAVFSYGANENIEMKVEHSRDQLERIIKDYNKMFDTNFSVDDYQGYNKDIQNRLKIKKLPQLDILIVVNMYLTGFDSKPLNTLYVDKNLEYHSLLQAYSRTNRVEKETKQFGNIVCYRNLKQNTDKALTLFSGGGDISEILMKPYEFYENRFVKLIEKLRKIASSADEVVKIIDENKQREFVLTFRDLSKELLTLKTFTEFTWDKFEEIFTNQDYEDYKGQYLRIHDEIKKVDGSGKVSILDDIDFTLDVIKVDKINVAYIINLMRNIDLSDSKKYKKDIEDIKRELNRATDPNLRKKIDLIKEFLDNVIPEMEKDSDIVEAYSNFEDEIRNKEIQIFVDNNKLNLESFKEIISEFDFTHKFNDNAIRNSLPSGIKYLEKRTLTEKIKTFIKENYEKYN